MTAPTLTLDQWRSVWCMAVDHGKYSAALAIFSLMALDGYTAEAEFDREALVAAMKDALAGVRS